MCFFAKRSIFIRKINSYNYVGMENFNLKEFSKEKKKILDRFGFSGDGDDGGRANVSRPVASPKSVYGRIFCYLLLAAPFFPGRRFS